MASAPPRRRHVLLYGTSANPPTALQGHMGAVAHCRSLFDEVWLLPVYQHIYSSKRALAPFAHRVAMLELATRLLPPPHGDDDGGDAGARVLVKESERELFEHLAAQAEDPAQLRIGTIDLVEFLRAQHPDTAFSMLLGADTYADLRAGKWKRGEELQRLVRFVVMDRQGVASPWRHERTSDEIHEQQASDEGGEQEPPRVRFITVPALSDVSSTQVRATGDVATLRALVGEDVAAYIAEHQLYAFAE